VDQIIKPERFIHPLTDHLKTRVSLRFLFPKRGYGLQPRIAALRGYHGNKVRFRSLNRKAVAPFF
jgi:RNA binding exosome subunit